MLKCCRVSFLHGERGDGDDDAAKSVHPAARAFGARRQVAARHGAAPRALDNFLGARLAGAGADRNRRRHFLDAVLARTVALSTAARPRHRAVRVCHTRCRFTRAANALARTGRRGRFEPARSRQRIAPPAGDGDCRRTRGHAARSVFAGALEKSSRAHIGGRALVQGRLAVAAPVRERPLRATRSRAHRRHSHLCRRRRRTLETHRGGIRLAGRSTAGEFPRRRLGHSTRLHR